MDEKDKQEPNLLRDSLEEDPNPISDRIQYDLDHREINDFEKARDKLQELMDNRNNGASYGDHADKKYKRVPPKVLGYHRNLGKRPFWFYFLVYVVIIGCILYWGGSMLMNKKTMDLATGKITKVDPAKNQNSSANGYVTVKDIIKKKDCMMVLVELKNDQADPLYASSSGFSISDQKGNVYGPDIQKSQINESYISHGLAEGQTAELMLYYDAPYSNGMMLNARMTIGYQPVSLNVAI